MARKPLVKPSLQKNSFFKILLGNFSKRLRIPPNLIQNFNERSLRKCALRGPSGKWWDVKLEKRNHGLFLHNGWQHFVKDLEDGDLLISRFDGESQFKVKVYGKTACEKGAEVAETRSGSPVCSGIEENTRGKNESVDLGNEEYNANCEKRTSKSGRSGGNHVNSGKRPEDDHAAETSNESILFKSKSLCLLI